MPEIDDNADSSNNEFKINFNDDLSKILYSWREKVSRDEGVHPSLILNDDTLKDLVRTIPTTDEEIEKIENNRGVTLDEFVDTLKYIIREYVKQNNIGLESKPYQDKKESKRHAKTQFSQKNSGKAYSVEEIRKSFPKAYEKWVENEDVLLKEEFLKNQSIRGLSQLFGRKPGAIRSRAKKLGLYEKMHFTKSKTDMSENEVEKITTSPLQPTENDFSDEYDKGVPNYANIILETIYEKDGKFGKTIISGILTGSEREKILKNNLKQMRHYGAIKRLTQKSVMKIIDELISKEYLENIHMGIYYLRPTLKLSIKGKNALENNEILELNIPIKSEIERDGYDLNIFNKLKEWRLERARLDQISPYCIMHDSTLEHISSELPSNERELELVKGVGEIIIRKYGEDILHIVNREDFEKPLKMAEVAPEVYNKEPGVSGGKSKSSEGEKDKLFHNIHKLENKPPFSEIKNQINKAIIEYPELRKSLSARKSWIDKFFDINSLSSQDEKRRARVFLTCRVTELNRK